MNAGRLLPLALLFCSLATWSMGQNDFLNPRPGGGNAFLGPQPGGVPGGPQGQQGGGFPGGAASADFDSLIDLIQSTVAPDTWVDNGGTADIRPFPGGVWIDPRGVLKLADDKVRGEESLVAPPVPTGEREPGSVRSAAKLRCVSLTRLEAAVFHAMRDGKPLTEEMLTLAGLQRVEFVFVYPASREIVLAGPAGDWKLDQGGRLIATENGQPVVRLDDLLTLMRREREFKGKPFGCSITPREENLATTQRVLAESAAAPLPAGKKAREEWLEKIRTAMGEQDIEVFGIDPTSHAARVLVEADHHMKRVGLGLADGVSGMENYLDLVAAQNEEAPVGVMRWWFATNYQGVVRNSDSTAMELRGQGVRVLSENEMLTQQGKRVATGRSDEESQQFANGFTTKFDRLAQKYPVYGELRNLFDLAVVAALIESSDLYTLAGWEPVLMLDAKHLKLPRYRTPTETETIMAHKVAGKSRIVAAASGGVLIDGGKVIESDVEGSDRARLDYHRERQPDNLASGVWWWDLE